MADLRRPVYRFSHGTTADYPILLAESRSSLWTAESSVESGLQFGKVQNLRRACQRLHRIKVPAGAIFSFWKHVGKATKTSGYAPGRELRHGCLIPTIGGGLCQLSNALYDLTLRCGFEIVERHAHTAVVPGSPAEYGRDATLFWNYVDFRFRPHQDLLIKAALSHNELLVSFWGQSRTTSVPGSNTQHRARTIVNTCTDCGVAGCFRQVHAGTSKSSGRAAFLMEECWPEFEEFAQQEKSLQDEDELFLPFRSRLAPVARYQGDTTGYRRVVSANFTSAISSIKARWLPDGKPPIAHQVLRSEALAEFYGERLPVDVSHLYVAQTVLPFLWRRGDLGGRNFSVLMTRLPLAVLHPQLDQLSAAFPDRKTFQEFRAPQWMVEAEAEALEHAAEIVTAHSLLAALFPSKTRLLQWKLPPAKSGGHGRCIVFPGPAVARKGAYELRDSLRTLGCPLLVLNTQTQETERFWHGFSMTAAASDWLQQAAVVVAPAFLENNPRPLLKALAAGIPVIATPECGIQAHPLLTLVPAGKSDALTKALRAILRS